MPAVPGAPAPPTLSRIVNWDITHLKTAARDWASVAEGWEDTFSTAHRAALAPGGTDWDGHAAEATQQRTLADLFKVRGLADTLHSSAGIASKGAEDLESAKQQVLESVRRAEEAGFDVHDYLLTEQPAWVHRGGVSGETRAGAGARRGDQYTSTLPRRTRC